MNATQKKTTKAARKPARPVTETLLELVYLMHTTKVVGRREPEAPRPGRSV
ncbi:hypothetical protein GobsT_70670 [Gemmata obscuriglobus]|uniref:hypothetical protein n=1 Tax=Gemmata obscuriglobus TaxID=114 RepID=UPI00016C5891|nr:hypothetical protein [Gemmata obscuriglobus]QEG32215.1 hypothetical protein GobsT_70670 [Gemmata obscuriglobus]VTS11568.1 unnamed protein product [Gemmata obscuriglobus UQM 2246]